MLLGSGVDVVNATMWFLMLIVVPLAVATSSREANAKYGWLNHVAQLIWIVARFAIVPQTPAGFAGRGLAPISIFVWKEVSLRSPSMLLFNHVLINVTMLIVMYMTADGQNFELTLAFLRLPVMSVLMMALFCYRRSRPIDDTPNESCIRERCAEMLSFVLESGD